MKVNVCDLLNPVKQCVREKVPTTQSYGIVTGFLSDVL